MGSHCNSAADDTGRLTTRPDAKPIIRMDISNNGFRDLNSLGQAEQYLLDRFQYLNNLDISKNKLKAIPMRLLKVNRSLRNEVGSIIKFKS